MTEYYGIIPARYGSTRFMGKALVDICGKPMFWHVWQRACECNLLCSVTLATDDERIFKAACDLNVPVVMTSDKHQSGTDRVYEAACQLGLPDEAIVVNIQGDEPLLKSQMLDEILSPFVDLKVQVSTLATIIDEQRVVSDSQVKVVLAKNGDALYFSRSPIPFNRSQDHVNYLGHIGLYAFRMQALRKFVSLPVSDLEQIEKLEQLRLLENNIPIRVVCTGLHSQGVDTPEDLSLVLKQINNN